MLFASWRDASPPLTLVAQLGVGPTADCFSLGFACFLPLKSDFYDF
jgi:hypothetical protein